MEAKLGTDLRTYTRDNPLWFTDNPVDMRAGLNLKSGRPWEWTWRVAENRVESWANWVRRHVRKHMFYM